MTAADLAALERLTTPISDEEIAHFEQCAIGWKTADVRDLVYRLIAERRSDAATIARQSAEVERMRAVVEAATTLHRRDEWHEDDGNVIWWTLPIEEPPYVGTLLDEEIPDYVTHWTRLVVPVF